MRRYLAIRSRYHSTGYSHSSSHPFEGRCSVRGEEILRTIDERSQGCRLGRFRAALHTFDLRVACLGAFRRVSARHDAVRVVRRRRPPTIFDPPLSSPATLPFHFSLPRTKPLTMPHNSPSIAPRWYVNERPFIVSLLNSYNSERNRVPKRELWHMYRENFILPYLL